MKDKSTNAMTVGFAIAAVFLTLSTPLLGCFGGEGGYGLMLATAILGPLAWVLTTLGLFRSSRDMAVRPKGLLLTAFCLATTFTAVAYIQLQLFKAPSEGLEAVRQTVSMAVSSLLPALLLWMAIEGVPFLGSDGDIVAVETKEAATSGRDSLQNQCHQVSVCLPTTGRVTVEFDPPALGVPVQVQIGSTLISISNGAAPSSN